MIINPGVDNIEARCDDEFKYMIKKYPTVAFNIHNWIDGNNVSSPKKNILFATEGYITIPGNYDPNIIKKYDAFITYSEKFKSKYPELNIYTTYGPIKWQHYCVLDNFVSYENKIRGICCLARVYNTGVEFDINYMKHTVMRDLNTEPYLVLHTYGPAPFGKEGSYKGKPSKRHHSDIDNLTKLSEYMFCWCPEPMYHEFWSHNYVTERLFNCFKAKTVAIYFGCYNIEELVPTDFFVDFRNFKDLDSLSDFLIELSRDKERYNYMVNAAYEWNLTNEIGDIIKLEKLLTYCINKYKS